MYIILGLGNIGSEYKNTRHNMGFMAIDAIANELNITERAKEGFHSYYVETRYEGEKIVLAKPTTYMNNSGLAAVNLMNWYKCCPEQLIVIYDDIEIPCGDLRIRDKGSSGTHNGMRSIIYQLGFDNFPRIRIGVGKQKDGRELAAHVLGVPSDEEAELLEKSIKNAASAALLMVKGEIKEAQAKYNTKKKKSDKEQKNAASINNQDNAQDSANPDSDRQALNKSNADN